MTDVMVSLSNHILPWAKVGIDSKRGGKEGLYKNIVLGVVILV
jgi:hypothetical protein